MNDEQFMKLFKLVADVQRDVQELRESAMTRADGDRILRILDELHAKADTDDLERAAMSVQLSRHEVWIEQASPQIGLTYDPSASA